MNRRSFAILAVIAVLLAGVAWFAQRGGGSSSIAGASAGQLLVPGLADELSDITAIEIVGAGDARLARLERTGEQWTVAEQDGYAAATGKVNSLLIALAEARIVEEKTANPEFHARLGVEAVASAEAMGVQVALSGDDGASFEIVLGDTYGQDQRYARLAASEQSVLIDRNPDVARTASDWVQPEILAIPANRVQRVEVAHADGETLVIHKDARELTDFQVERVPEARELEYAGVANVTGSVLQNLNLEEVSRRADTPGERVSITEFRTFDGLVITVTAFAAEEPEAEPWLTFDARFDAEQALDFATGTVDDLGAAAADAETEVADAAADATDDDAGAADGAAAPAADTIAEAEAINERLAAWRFRIPAYQYSQMSRRMEDLLRPPPSE